MANDTVPDTVLIVDDDPVIRHILSTVIKSAGHAVQCVGTGAECLAAIDIALTNQCLPVVVFLDYFLDDMSGQEVLSALRKKAPNAYLPVILISAKSRDEMISDTTEYTPDYFLEKPFKSDVVLSLIEAAKQNKPA